MIKEYCIDNVREADVVQVIGHYCDLKRAGSLYECRSPFSEDKTASFKVNPTKNNWVCYSTDQKGDVIKFVMIRENCTFIEAVEKIASICGIVLEHEEVSETQKLRMNAREKQLKVLQSVADMYAKELKSLPQDHWVRNTLTARQFTQESILEFGIGYAPGYRKVTKALTEKALFDIGKDTGLISVKSETGNDFFNDRLMFPIHNVKGEVIGFGGRQSGEHKDSPKYLNSKESEVYSKTKTIYGLYQAKNVIAKKQMAVLMEGYTDVIASHQNGVDYAVATCGTALTDKQAELLKRYTHTVTICRDNDGYDEQGNDKAGTRAAMKDVNILLKAGHRVLVCLLPEGEDPDSFSRKIDLKKFIEENSKDAVIWKAERLKNKAANDPYAISDALKQVAEMLFCIKDDFAKKDYTKHCAKIFKVSVKEVSTLIEDLQRAKELDLQKKAKVSEEDLANLNLPPGADYQEFLQHRFLTIGNSYFFRGKEGFFKGTNFRLTPLFHVYGQKNNKRVCEVVNELGTKKIIEFDSDDFIQKTRFEKKLIDESFFVFTENTNANQFKLLANRTLSEFFTAYELTTLCWQNKEKFFAYADCIWHNGNMKKVNQYGLVELDFTEDDQEEESEYFEKAKYFYSPAFSELYKHSRDDDDSYENDRYMVYKKSPVSLETWMKQFYKVYGEKSMTGLCFLMSTMFRDIFLKRWQFFPHLFLTGEKGSGKSKFGESLVALFTYKQEAFDLNSGTLVAFSRRLARLNNAPTMLEEFTDAVDDKIFQSIKGAYDGRGREMGKATGDNRTSTTRVNSSLIILSQYLSSRDDNSLTSRSLLCHFIKPQDPFTDEEVKEYNLLKEWEEIGLSSMLIDILQHREFVAERLHKTYGEITSKLKKDLKGKDYQERMMQNYVALLAPLKLLSEKISFPFTYEEAYKYFKNMILESSDLIVESEGLAEFWRVMEYLLDRGFIKEGEHFKIDAKPTVKLFTRKGENDIIWSNNNHKRLLFLRLNAVHQLYHKEVSMREGVEVITENTIRNYFKSKKYYIGTANSERIGKVSTSVMIFDYDAMLHGGILNLDRNENEYPDDTIDVAGAPIVDNKNDDLPF